MTQEKFYGSDYANWKGWLSNHFGDLNKSQRKYYTAEIKRLGLLSKPGIRVLEVGFGAGDFLTFAGEQGWNASGIEVNESLVEIAKSRGFNVFSGSDLSLFEENSFDLVVAFDVLEHISDNEMTHFLRSVERVLKSTGIFLARFPNGDSPFGLMNQNGDVTHVNFLGRGKVDFYMSQINCDYVFIGGQVELIWGANPIGSLRRFVIFSFKWFINQFIYFLFGKSKYFCSENLVAAIKIKK